MTARGTRLENSGWHPDDAARSFAIMCGLDPDRIWAEFQDYWISKSGANATKMDWKRTWQNWCRKAEGDRKRRKPGGWAPNDSGLMPNVDITRRWVGGIAYTWPDVLKLKADLRAGREITEDERAAIEAWKR